MWILLVIIIAPLMEYAIAAFIGLMIFCGILDLLYFGGIIFDDLVWVGIIKANIYNNLLLAFGIAAFLVAIKKIYKKPIIVPAIIILVLMSLIQPKLEHQKYIINGNSADFEYPTILCKANTYYTVRSERGFFDAIIDGKKYDLKKKTRNGFFENKRTTFHFKLQQDTDVCIRFLLPKKSKIGKISIWKNVAAGPGIDLLAENT